VEVADSDMVSETEEGARDLMSVKALFWALKQQTGSPTAKLVLIKLADISNDEGYAWPSQNTVAEHCELSVRTVRDNVRRLELSGLLETVPRYDADGTTRLANHYRLRLDVPPRQIFPTERENSAGQPPAKSADNPSIIDTKEKIRAADAAAFSLPEWISSEAWAEFAAHRKRKRAPLTDAISRRIVAVLSELRRLRHDPGKVLHEAIDRNWTGIKVEWIHKGPRTPEPKPIRSRADRPKEPQFDPKVGELLSGLTKRLGS
jgi:hypothetical protein